MDTAEAEALRRRMMLTGERQYGTKIEDIKPNHTQRYEWAAAQLLERERVLDAGCGTGYGSAMIGRVATRVVGIDVSRESVQLAEHFWGTESVSFESHELHSMEVDGPFDAAVCFEVIEHLACPELFLLDLWRVVRPGSPCFFSTPNSNVEPHRCRTNPFHIRHRTPVELRDLLAGTGFGSIELFDQSGSPHKPNPIVKTAGKGGRFVLARCIRGRAAGRRLGQDADLRRELPRLQHELFIERCREIRSIREERRS